MNVACSGGTGSINISATGGISPYSFLWNDAITTANRSNLVPANYSLTVTDNNSCTASADIVIGSNSGIVINETHTDIACNGGTEGNINVTVTGGALPYSYVWNDTVTTLNRTNFSSGSYTLSVTDNNSCVQVLNVNITEPPALAVSETHTNVLCFGDNTGSINISPSGGEPPYTYLWNDSDTTQNRNNLGAGNYSVIMTDNNGCTTSINTITLSEPPILTLSETHKNVSCYGLNDASINVTSFGGTLPYSLVWSNNLSDNFNLGPGNYSATVTDNNGCSSSISIAISQPDPLAVTVVSVTDDDGTNSGAIDISVSGGTSPYDYLWNNFEITQDLTQLSGGSYIIFITDSNGCNIYDTIVVPLNTSLVKVVETYLKIYPNPFTTELLIDFHANINQPCTFKIISLQGALIRTIEANAKHSVIDVSDIPPSIYFVELSSGNLLRRIKMLKAE